MAAADVRPPGGPRPPGDQQPGDNHPATGPPQGTPALCRAEARRRLSQLCPCAHVHTPVYVCMHLWIPVIVLKKSGLRAKNAR